MNYYFDTSIWMDFFENRDEPHLPKGELAHKLMTHIAKNNDKIICSDFVVAELRLADYPLFEIEGLFEKLNHIIIWVESTEKQIRKAKDLSAKRGIPKKDAAHALIARDNKAVLITLDRHFQRLLDIVKVRRPQDII
ncbi:MAG TPA: PIN domain-containing protein [Candidatus Nanoarchaeia archaeon]|nr:PIN domain-containing protein [Candidatus Nanoarchaeia archaeon]